MSARTRVCWAGGSAGRVLIRLDQTGSMFSALPPHPSVCRRVRRTASGNTVCCGRCGRNQPWRLGWALARLRQGACCPTWLQENCATVRKKLSEPKNSGELMIMLRPWPCQICWKACRAQTPLGTPGQAGLAQSGVLHGGPLVSHSLCGFALATPGSARHSEFTYFMVMR